MLEDIGMLRFHNYVSQPQAGDQEMWWYGGMVQRPKSQRINGIDSIPGLKTWDQEH